MKLHSYRITYDHREGDGIFRTQTGRPSGRSTCLMHGHPSAKDSQETFEASYRHGTNVEAVEEAEDA